MFSGSVDAVQLVSNSCRISWNTATTLCMIRSCLGIMHQIDSSLTHTPVKILYVRTTKYNSELYIDSKFSIYGRRLCRINCDQTSIAVCAVDNYFVNVGLPYVTMTRDFLLVRMAVHPITMLLTSIWNTFIKKSVSLWVQSNMMTNTRASSSYKEKEKVVIVIKIIQWTSQGQ